MEEDILFNCAQSFNNLLKYDYCYHTGNKQRNYKISVLSNKKENFVHIVGLDHLTDIDCVIGNNTQQKRRIFKRILDAEITFNDIKNSRKYRTKLLLCNRGGT